jgi:hypothetical protein
MKLGSFVRLIVLFIHYGKPAGAKLSSSFINAVLSSTSP